MIHNDRFTIRRIHPGDVDGLYMIFEDFSKSAYRIYDYPVSLDMENIIRITLSFSLQETFFGVFTPDGKRMMGYITFDGEGGVWEMGYSFHTHFHGKGTAYCSCREAMEYMQREYVVNKFTAVSAMENIPSVKLLEKLGFVLARKEKMAFHKDENGCDMEFTGGIFEKYCI